MITLKPEDGSIGDIGFGYILGNAARLVDLSLSFGSVQTLLKMGVSETDLGLEALRRAAAHYLGDVPQPWLWSVRLCVGINAL